MSEIRDWLDSVESGVCADCTRVAVVRCKDCKHYYVMSGDTDKMCHRFVEADDGLMICDDDYCSYGEYVADFTDYTDTCECFEQRGVE